jgi:hypothetical protein
MVESAEAISELYATMKKWSLSASAYPFPGLCLLTAATVHTMFAIFEWESMSTLITHNSSRDLLRKDMEAFNDIGQYWPLAIHWVCDAPDKLRAI